MRREPAEPRAAPHGANLLNRWRRAHRDRSPRPPPDSGEAAARERFPVSAVVAEAGAATAETGAATPAGGGGKPLPAPQSRSPFSQGHVHDSPALDLPVA